MLRSFLEWVWGWLKSGSERPGVDSPGQQMLAEAEMKNPWNVVDLAFRQMLNILAGGLLGGLALSVGFMALMLMSLEHGFSLNVDEIGSLQFLVAGIIPAFLLPVGWIVFRMLAELPKWTRMKLGRKSRLVLTVVSYTGGTAGFLVVLAAGVLSDVAPGETAENIGRFAVFTFAGSLLLRVFVTDRDVMARFLYRFYTIGGIIALVTLGVVLYSLEVLPWLPQELGGSRPKCVKVDLQTQGLTPETLQALGYETTPEASPSGVKSFDLQQLFSSDDNLFILAPVDGNLLEQQVIKLNKSLVQASRASENCSEVAVT